MSHILIALIISELFNIKKKSLVVLGALMPDFFVKIVVLVNFFKLPYDILYWFFYPLHTPIGCILITLLVVPFFRYNQRAISTEVHAELHGHHVGDKYRCGQQGRFWYHYT